MPQYAWRPTCLAGDAGWPPPARPRRHHGPARALGVKRWGLVNSRPSTGQTLVKRRFNTGQTPVKSKPDAGCVSRVPRRASQPASSPSGPLKHLPRRRRLARPPPIHPLRGFVAVGAGYGYRRAGAGDECFVAVGAGPRRRLRSPRLRSLGPTRAGGYLRAYTGSRLGSPASRAAASVRPNAGRIEA
jgi:hypothetical protein